MGLSRGAPISEDDRHPYGALGVVMQGDAESKLVLVVMLVGRDVEKRAAARRRGCTLGRSESGPAVWCLPR